MNLTIIGSGYVGLTTGTCFLRKWATTSSVWTITRKKIRTLQSGSIPIYEPKLEELVKKNVAVGRLEFSPSIADSIAESEVIFIAVPTPPNTDGSVDLTYIEKVAREIAQVLQPEMGYKVIVDKSTVPVKTGEKVRQTIKRYAGTDVQFDIVSNPEFLREGCAVDDLLHPDRIVIGANSERAMDVIKRVYQPIHAPILETDVNSAELIKHAANSFLALKNFLHQRRRQGLRKNGSGRGTGGGRHRHGQANLPPLPQRGTGLRGLLLPEGRQSLHQHQPHAGHSWRTSCATASSLTEGTSSLRPTSGPLDLSTIPWAGPPLKKPDRCRE